MPSHVGGQHILVYGDDDLTPLRFSFFGTFFSYLDRGRDMDVMCYRGFRCCLDVFGIRTNYAVSPIGILCKGPWGKWNYCVAILIYPRTYNFFCVVCRSIMNEGITYLQLTNNLLFKMSYSSSSPPSPITFVKSPYCYVYVYLYRGIPHSRGRPLYTHTHTQTSTHSFDEPYVPSRPAGITQRYMPRYIILTVEFSCALSSVDICSYVEVVVVEEVNNTKCQSAR